MPRPQHLPNSGLPSDQHLADIRHASGDDCAKKHPDVFLTRGASRADSAVDLTRSRLPASSSRSPAIVDGDPERPSPTADMSRASAAWQPHYAPLVRLIPSSNRPAPPGLTPPSISSDLWRHAVKRGAPNTVLSRIKWGPNWAKRIWRKKYFRNRALQR